MNSPIFPRPGVPAASSTGTAFGGMWADPLTAARPLRAWASAAGIESARVDPPVAAAAVVAGHLLASWYGSVVLVPGPGVPQRWRPGTQPARAAAAVLLRVSGRKELALSAAEEAAVEDLVGSEVPRSLAHAVLTSLEWLRESVTEYELPAVARAAAADLCAGAALPEAAWWLLEELAT